MSLQRPFIFDKTFSKKFLQVQFIVDSDIFSYSSIKYLARKFSRDISISFNNITLNSIILNGACSVTAAYRTVDSAERVQLSPCALQKMKKSRRADNVENKMKQEEREKSIEDKAQRSAGCIH